MKLIDTGKRFGMKLSVFAALSKRNVSTITKWFNTLEKAKRRPPTLDEMNVIAEANINSQHPQDISRTQKYIETCEGPMTAREVVQWIKDKYGEEEAPSTQGIYNRRAKYGDKSPMVMYPKVGIKEFAEMAVRDGLFPSTNDFFKKIPKSPAHPTSMVKSSTIAAFGVKTGTFEYDLIYNREANKRKFKSRQAVLDKQYAQAIRSSRCRSAMY